MTFLKMFLHYKNTEMKGIPNAEIAYRVIEEVVFSAWEVAKISTISCQVARDKIILRSQVKNLF